MFLSKEEVMYYSWTPPNKYNYISKGSANISEFSI